MISPGFIPDINLSDLESVAMAADSYKGRLELSGACSPSTVLSLIRCIRDLQKRLPGISFEKEFNISV